MRFPLTVGSADAYFVDDIGNVSTSRFRSNVREANLELKPRYPLFGGWNYSFKVGWNGDLKNYLRHVKGGSDSYVLKVPFLDGPKQAEGVEYERVVTRIVLPEGARYVSEQTPIKRVSVLSGNLAMSASNPQSRSCPIRPAYNERSWTPLAVLLSL